MAEDIFRVEVGVNTELSTGKVKNEIQAMLNDISKQPPEVTVGASKDSKGQIEKDLTKLFENNNSVCGITLGVKGGGNIRGSTGKALTKDVLALTSTISQQKVAKITLHLDTEATQKAMLAELKKLKLGVNITPTNGGSETDSQNAKDIQAQNAAISRMVYLRQQQYEWEKKAESSGANSRKQTYDRTQVQDYLDQYKEVRNDFLGTDAAKRLGSTADAMDDLVVKYDGVVAASKRVGEAVENMADKTAKADAEAEKALRKELMGQAETAWKNVYDTQTKMVGIDQSSPAYQQLTKEINAYQATLDKLRDSAKQGFGISEDDFNAEVAGYEKVTKAAKKYQEAVNGASAKAAKQSKADYQNLVKEAAEIRKKIYALKTSQSKTNQPAANVQIDQDAINKQWQAYKAKVDQANAQFGVSKKSFKQDVANYKGVSEAADNYTKALNRNAEAQKKQKDAKEASQKQLSADIESSIAKEISKLNQGSSKGIEYTAKFKALAEQLKKSGVSAKEARRQIADLGREAKEQGAVAETAGQKFARMLGTKIGYATVALLMGQVTKALRQVYSNVVTLDEGMTELKKVTDETDATYSKFLDNAASRAKSLGSTMSNVVSATASFARLGYSLEEATQLADAAVVYEHVGDEIDSIDDASNSVISTMQAFGIEAKDVMSIVDKFNQVGNTMPISSGGLGEAMQRSAAAMKAAGNTIDETLALIASMNAVIQNPETVGTTLKTVSMYLRAAKTEAEAAGESTDGMAESVSKLRDEIKALTGNQVDIMVDAAGTQFKSTYQILKDLSQVWDKLTDINKANILEKLGGKRNANAVSAVIEQFDLAEKALLESQNSAGSAMAENEKVLDSINGKLNQLNASWEQLSSNVLNSELVKGAIDLLRGIVEMFNKLDEATNGVSSNILTLVVSFTLVTSVLSAFNSKLGDSESLLGAFFGLFSKVGRSQMYSDVTQGISLLQRLWQQLKDDADLAGGSMKNALLGLITPGMKVVAALAAIAATFGMIYVGMKKLKGPSLSVLQDQSSDLRAEVDELSSSVETANERIKELDALASAGTISLTEQDELDRLRTQNNLLQAQLDLQKALLEVSEQQEADKARKDAKAFFKDNSGTKEYAPEDQWMAYETEVKQESPYEKITKLKDEILDIDEQIEAKQSELTSASTEDAKKINDAIVELQSQRAEKLSKIGDLAEPLNDILGSLDPSNTEDAALIKKIKNLTYQIQYLTGDATALKSVFDDFWSDTASHPGIDEMREKLEKAATAQAEYNEELKKYGGNVDLTNRPHVKIDDRLKKRYPEWWGGSDEKYSTLVSARYDADAMGSDSGQSLVITPILPNGKVLSAVELDRYVDGLMGADGKFDVSQDDQGLVIAVVDEGSAEKSKKVADEISESCHQVNEAFHELQETDVWDDFLDALKAVGFHVDELSQADLASMFEVWAESSEESAVSLAGFADALDKLTEKHELLKSAQDELSSSGTISASTLSSIAEKFPKLSDDVTLYIAGLKSGKELIESLSAAYQSDADAYKDSLKEKLSATPTFYNDLTDKQKKLINDLADSYKVDLGNFETIEQAKLNFQAEIIAKLAANYSKYTGASLQELKQYQTALQNDIASGEGNTHRYQYELARVTEAIRAAESMQSVYDSIKFGDLNSWDPSKYDDKSSSSSSSDSYKKAVEEKIDALKHQLQMEKITSEQYYNGLEAIENQYYKDSAAHAKKYADEIRSIDEELFDGRRELNEDWLNDQQDFAERAGAGGDYSAQKDYYNGMFSKLQEMIKAAKEYGLDESSDYVQELYDKVDQLQSDILSSVKNSFEQFESYMDDFDLWKGSDFSKLEWLKKELQAIIDLYNKGQLSWEQYTEARNDIAAKMYDTQRDSLEEILDLTMDMIKQEAEDQVEALDDQIDAYQKIIDKKRELLQDTSDELDHEEEVAEKVKEIAELQSKIAQLSLDDSREAAAKKSSLEEELYEKQRELEKLQRDYSLDQTLDMLDKSQEAFEDEKEAEKDAVEDSVDSWQKLYEKAIKRINGSWSSLYSDLKEYMAEHRDSIDGPDSLETAWKNATTAMQEYNNSFEDAYNNAGNNAINPNANQSAEAQAILAKMNQNSALAKSLGTSKVGTPGTSGYRDLHQENIELAAQYEELTGQRLVYDNTAGWKYDNSTSGSTINKTSTTTKANTSTSSKTQSSEGAAYKATKAKYGTEPPSGTLKEGVSKGKDVEWLQYYLKQLGYFPSDVAVDGQFYSRTKKALKEFQADHELDPDGIYGAKTRKIIPSYHTGGIVGNAGSINDTEVLALLKKGEWVLDDRRKQNLKEMFANLKAAASGMVSSAALNRMQSMTPAAVTGGDTFAPQISVSIQHNGSMSDKDAKQYGNMVANTALEQLKNAFNKRGKK